MKKIYLILLVGILTISFIGCEKENIEPPQPTPTIVDTTTIPIDTTTIPIDTTQLSEIYNDMLTHTFLVRRHDSTHSIVITAHFWAFDSTGYVTKGIDTTLNHYPEEVLLSFSEVVTTTMIGGHPGWVYEDNIVYGDIPGWDNTIKIIYNDKYHNNDFIGTWAYDSKYKIMLHDQYNHQVSINGYGYLEVMDTLFQYTLMSE